MRQITILDPPYLLSTRTLALRPYMNNYKSVADFCSEHCSPICTFGGDSGKKALDTLHAMFDDELEQGIGYHRILH